jgi:hypothetical protein
MKLNLDNQSLVKLILVVCLVSLLVYLFVFQPSIQSVKLVQDKRKSIETTFDEDSGPDCIEGQLCPGGFPCPQTSKCPDCKEALTIVCGDEKNKGLNQCLNCISENQEVLKNSLCSEEEVNPWCNQTPPPPPSGNCKQKLQEIINKYNPRDLITYDNKGYYKNNFQGWFDDVLNKMKSESDKQDFVSCVEDRDFLKNLNLHNLTTMFDSIDFKDPNYSIGKYQLDISKWDTSQVTNMKGMFNEATNIPDISYKEETNAWNTSKVTDMSEMFALATNIPYISYWDVSQVTDMNRMFANTKHIPWIGGWDVSSVTDMNGMFSDSDSGIYGIGDWDVSSVTDMSGMFIRNKKFNEDLSGWTLNKNGVKVYHMFDGATSMNTKHTPIDPTTRERIPVHNLFNLYI